MTARWGIQRSDTTPADPLPWALAEPVLVDEDPPRLEVASWTATGGEQLGGAWTTEDASLASRYAAALPGCIVVHFGDVPDPPGPTESEAAAKLAEREKARLVAVDVVIEAKALAGDATAETVRAKREAAKAADREKATR